MSFDENGNIEGSTKSSVVKEQVKPKFKRKLKRVFGVIFLAVLAAVVFGFVARLIFIKSEDLAYKLLGVEKQDKNDEKTPERTDIILSGNWGVTSTPEVTAPVVTQPVEVVEPTKAATPVPTEPVDVETSPAITPVEVVVENKTPDDNSKGGEVQTGEELGNEISHGQTIVSTISDSGENMDFSLNDYMLMMGELHEMTDNISTGVVTVRAKTSTVNWMGDDMETTTEAFGGFFAENSMEYLFVTYYDKILNADSISVVLCTGNEYNARLFERDTNYNMAVISVPIRSVSEEDRNIISKLVFSNTYEIYAGMPVIALGSPNGNAGSLEYGFVTGCNDKVYVVDGELSIFTTDITNSSESEGVIVNYLGEVIGIISRTLDVPQRNYASSSIGIESISNLIIEMCNGRERPFVGIRAENIPEAALTELGQENGIYINDVVAGSPADEAGLRKGDIILKINGENVDSVAGFMQTVMERNDNEGLELVIYRGSKVSNPEMNVIVKPKGR